MMQLLMEGTQGTIYSDGTILYMGPNCLRKSPDHGVTLQPLTESDLAEFRAGNLFEDVQTLDDNTKTLPVPGSFLSEEKGSDGFLYIIGPMARCDKKNGNGRVYERGIWESVVGNKNIIERFEKGGSMGHLEHPKDGKTNLSLISHIMVPYNKDGIFAINEDGLVYGKARILNTTSGKELQEVYRGGGLVGFSSRGKGSTFKRGNVDYVAKDYMYDTHDAVASPSVIEATPKLEEQVFSSKSQYTLESIQPQGIELNTEETSMSNSKDQLKALEQNLRGLAKSLDESNDAIALASLREGLLDQQMAIRALVESDPTIRDAAEELTSQAKELRTEVTAKMESLKDQKIDEAVEAATSQTLTEDNSDVSLHNTLRETKERLDYYRNLCEELASSDDAVSRREYEAALALSEGLLKKCREFQSDNAELTEALEAAGGAGALTEGIGEHPDYKLLEERYEKALLIIEELADRIRAAQVSDRVEEVIKIEPRFARIRDDLLECKTVDEVNSRVDRLCRLFNGSDLVESKEEELVDEDTHSMTEEEALAALSGASLDESQTDIPEDVPQVQLSEGQRHRLGLINAICRTSNFRK